MKFSNVVFLTYDFYSKELTFAPYMFGLYQLILLCMGVDYRTGQEIKKDDLIYDIHQEMKGAFSKDASNPWKAGEFFNKEVFFEYQLAKVFLENPELAKKAKEVVDLGFFRSFYYYEQLDKLVDKEGNSLKDRKQKYYLCEPLQLAASFSQGLRYLWAAFKSDKALRAILELEDDAYSYVIKAYDWITWQNYSVCGGQTKVDAFLKIWEEIQSIFFKNTQKKEFASFSGHGVLISFEKDLMELQAKSDIFDAFRMKKLGFALIDSLYGAALNLWYRKSIKTHPKG